MKPMTLALSTACALLTIACLSLAGMLKVERELTQRAVALLEEVSATRNSVLTELVEMKMENLNKSFKPTKGDAQ